MPVSDAIGGLYGLLRRAGITLRPGPNASIEVDAAVDFDGTVNIDGATTATVMPTIKGDDIKLIHQGAIAAVDTAGGIFSWVNPWSVPVLILNVFLEVTTASTGACTVDIGIAANATTSDDTLLDGQDVNAATGIFAADGGPLRLDEAGGTADTVTISRATGASAGIVGRAYIEYVPIQ